MSVRDSIAHNMRVLGAATRIFAELSSPRSSMMSNTISRSTSCALCLLRTSSVSWTTSSGGMMLPLLISSGAGTISRVSPKTTLLFIPAAYGLREYLGVAVKK